ncbi:SCP2 sterol-binding domain-containing protein [Marinobacter nauticus]
MLGSDLAAILQTGLNRALALDPAGRAALMQSLAQPVGIRLTTPLEAVVSLSIDEPLVRVKNQACENAVATIIGGPIALASLALGDPRVISDGRLTVEGDHEKALQLQQAIAQLDPDWEAAMARHLGDVPAHLLGKALRNAVQWSRQAMASVTANLEEYIHEETRTLPGRRELAARTQAIADLEHRTNALDAKLTALGNTDSDHQTEKP